MALTPIQTPDVINVYDRFNPGDLSIPPGAFDPETLTPVISVDPGWVQPGFLAGAVAAASINGATVTQADIGMTVNVGDTPTTAHYRLYNIFCRLAGGTVTPLVLNVTYSGGAAVQTVAQVEVSNPGRILLGPFMVPPGMTIRIGNDANGGVGDTLATFYSGFQSLPGVPMPFAAAYSGMNT